MPRRECKGVLAFRPGERLTQPDWERVFGPETERRRRFDAAIRAQAERRRLEQVADMNANGVAVHDDRDWGHKGIYSPCLGLVVKSRGHQKELEKRLNVTCTN